MGPNVENIEVIVEATAPKAQQLRLTLEKLDGGFISDISGKRKIYAETEDIIDALGMNKVINRLEHDEYQLNIDIIPKSEYKDYMELAVLSNKEEELTLESAKECGIIEEAVKFNPLKPEPVLDLDAPIKVTLATAYTASRLKGIKWAELHDELPLQPSEITRITGMNTTTLYASLPKARKGEFSFQHTSARVGFTILAMYYERTLGIRTSTKDQCEKMKEDMLKMIREIELIGNGQKFIKTAEVQKRLIAMRTTLL